ncbi:MAG: hypothetical protein ABI700_14520 [Chloroflexota bacterium]
MARTSKSTKAKGRNGEGDSLTVFFDQSDPAERRALEAARLLAAKHGRRKQVIVTLLESIYAYYEQTGDLLSATEIANALREGALPNFRPAPAVTAARPEATAPQPSIARAQAKKPRQPAETFIAVTQKQAIGKKGVTANFLSGISGWID